MPLDTTYHSNWFRSNASFRSQTRKAQPGAGHFFVAIGPPLFVAATLTTRILDNPVSPYHGGSSKNFRVDFAEER